MFLVIFKTKIGDMQHKIREKKPTNGLVLLSRKAEIHAHNIKLSP